MAGGRLVLVLDLGTDPAMWDPHEAIEDVLAHAEDLPSFEPGLSWFLTVTAALTDEDAHDFDVEGTFVAAEWSGTLLDRAAAALDEALGRQSTDAVDDIARASSRAVATAVLRAAGVLPTEKGETS